MDRVSLKQRALDVSATLSGFLQSQADALADEQEEQNVRLAANLRSNSEKLDERQSARDSQVISDVAAKTKALRDDVQRFGAERDEATAKSISAAVDQLAATLREEMRANRREITEEITVANRATYEALQAMIRELKAS